MMLFMAGTLEPSEWAGAIATLLGALGAFITALYSLKVGKGNKNKIEEVHTVVNGKSDALERRNTELIKVLQSHNIEIPAKKN